MFKLNGKKALVTGASGGIGAAICKDLLRSGVANLAISGSNKEKLEAFSVELKKEFVNATIHPLTCNLSNKEEVAGLITSANEKMSGLDILVCNAGITKDALSIRIKDDDWQAVLDINLTANFILNREAVKIMMKNRAGRIINITSIVGQTGNVGQANYAASKAGLVAMTKSIAQEVATRGVTVNAIAPGFIETHMTDVLPDAVKEAIKAKIPAASLGKAEDVSAAAVFLASDEARYITGQTINVNGGMHMSS